MNYSKS